MIDELDRCRPDYAITYLETIKHIFSIKGTAFVLANAMYELIGCGGLGYREAYDFLVKLFSGTDDERAYWWFRILFSGGALKVRYVEDMNNEFVQELLNTEGGREMFDSLSIKVNFTFPKIYKQIESFSPHKWSISMG